VFVIVSPAAFEIPQKYDNRIGPVEIHSSDPRRIFRVAGGMLACSRSTLDLSRDRDSSRMIQCATESLNVGNVMLPLSF